MRIRRIIVTAVVAAGAAGCGVPSPEASSPSTSSTSAPVASTTAPTSSPTSSSAPVSTTATTEAPTSPLERLEVAEEPAPRTGYDRDLFEHWITQPDGCTTRQRVLIDEAVDAPRVSGDCDIEGGRWRSLYDGVETTDPSDFDIDHLVPLAEAWDSGADGWDPARREAFANDLGAAESLVAVSASSNRSKGDQDPSEWRPPERTTWCAYAESWISVKIRWELRADPAEIDALGEMLGTCG